MRDLERLRSGYNVYVKVLTVEKKVVDARDGSKIQMANAVVGDETAVANSFFKGHRAALVEVGNVLAIRNGTKKYIKDFISLELDAFGRLTLEKEVAVESSL